jgi:hypothetical protein
MYRPFFEMIGAFAVWIFSGFKGKYEDHLGENANYSNAFYGIVFCIVIIILMIAAVRLI